MRKPSQEACSTGKPSQEACSTTFPNSSRLLSMPTKKKEIQEKKTILLVLLLLLTVFSVLTVGILLMILVAVIITCYLYWLSLSRSLENHYIACKRRREFSVFDRFNGFLGLPEEIEPGVPRRAPSASANVFGVSAESMQLCYDPRGNSVPTILLMMQRTLYAKGGLQVEGIFRINAENTQEEYVRDRLNRGIVPENIDVHSLAGLIKAWFRELPGGVLDSLSSEEVMQCRSKEDCMDLFRLLPSTEAALLEWAVNLMADVVQQEQANKMNVRNIAMVFAPNMTKMADPLKALMYVVQVMNFLKMLITKALKDREESMGGSSPCSIIKPSADNADRSPANACMGDDEPILESLKSEGTRIDTQSLYFRGQKGLKGLQI